MSFAWTGRQLDSISKNGETLASFIYDANGMRTGKTVGSENFTYLWQDGKRVASSTASVTEDISCTSIEMENG